MRQYSTNDPTRVGDRHLAEHPHDEDDEDAGQQIGDDAAGPVWFMTAPLPTKRPAPITPPREIIVMWRWRRERLRPVS